jgi:rRNA maturation endonuclease Nob1
MKIKRIGRKERFDALRFRTYHRFCHRCPRIFPTRAKTGRYCRNCSNRSTEIDI